MSVTEINEAFRIFNVCAISVFCFLLFGNEFNIITCILQVETCALMSLCSSADMFLEKKAVFHSRVEHSSVF